MFSTTDLQTQLDKIDRQKDMLDASPTFSEEHKKRLHEIYDEQKEIIQSALNERTVATENATSLQVFDYKYL